MKKTILTYLAFISFFALTASNPITEGEKEKDLLFVANFSKYADWLDKAFKVDTERRSQFCQESKTKIGKIDNKSAMISLVGFDMSKMGAFAGDPEMGKLMQKYKVEHNEVYIMHEDVKSAKSDNGKADLLFFVNSIDYDLWYENAFSPDSKRRGQFCDEARTKVARVSDKEAMVILYDFDLERLWDFGSDKEVESLMKKYQVEHKLYVLEGLQK
jgi:hypothetical protein